MNLYIKKTAVGGNFHFLTENVEFASIADIADLQKVVCYKKYDGIIVDDQFRGEVINIASNFQIYSTHVIEDYLACARESISTEKKIELILDALSANLGYC